MNLTAQRAASTLRGAGMALAFLLVAAPLAACSDEGKLVLHTATGDYPFNVEVVDTDATRAQGLMYRQELADDAGMLFDFKQEQRVSFWMRNTFIPLDMIFVDAQGVVKNIHVNARPHDPTGIPSDGPVQYVLEIPGGRSVAIGLKPGDTMDHARIKKPN
jgi:uncharacterized membrane protein (UPF0127 family)